jgi:hypothetical protein
MTDHRTAARAEQSHNLFVTAGHQANIFSGNIWPINIRKLTAT